MDIDFLFRITGVLDLNAVVSGIHRSISPCLDDGLSDATLTLLFVTGIDICRVVCCRKMAVEIRVCSVRELFSFTVMFM
jgi:hypothetical protein